jgi:hypothetical protein
VTSVEQSACLRDIKGMRAVKLCIEFVVAPLRIDTIIDFWAAYRSENLSLKYEQLVLLPFGQHPRLTAVEQDWADQGLVNGKFCIGVNGGSTADVCAVRRSTFLQSGFFVVFPESCHSLVSSGILGTQIL